MLTNGYLVLSRVFYEGQGFLLESLCLSLSRVLDKFLMNKKELPKTGYGIGFVSLKITCAVLLIKEL